MMTRGDCVLIVFLLVLSLGSLLFVNLFLFNIDASAVIIEVNGKSYAQYSLKELREPIKIKIDSEYGDNLLLLEQHQVSILQSSCPDKLEVKAGVITRAGQQLVCLPNRLVVRLEGSREDVDGVTY